MSRSLDISKTSKSRSTVQWTSIANKMTFIIPSYSNRQAAIVNTGQLVSFCDIIAFVNIQPSLKIRRSQNSLLYRLMCITMKACTSPTATPNLSEQTKLQQRYMQLPNHFSATRAIYRIAGIFRVYKFSRKCLQKGFRGFNFRGFGCFCCMHARNIKFAVLMFAVHA